MTEAEVAARRGLKGPVAIIGPTASGKTAAALEIARRTGAEIVSVDSMAVYRGMNIGTAKPTAEEQHLARFHMIDVVDPAETFTVADFQQKAAEIVDDIIDRRAMPLLVGGTGFYMRGLIDGLNLPGPGANKEIRERLEGIVQEKGALALHQMLAEVDPISATKLHPNDVKRVVRALEVFEQTGVAMSQAVERNKPSLPRYPDVLIFGLTMERELLYRRIEERVDQQVRDGLVAEVAGLLQKGCSPDLPAMQGLGYKEIVGHLKGQYDLDTAVSLLKRNTRRFAKRQLTWFRPDERIDWINVNGMTPSDVADAIEGKLREVDVI